MGTLTVQSDEAELPENLAVILIRAKARNKKRYRDLGVFSGVCSGIFLLGLILERTTNNASYLISILLITYAFAISFFVYSVPRSWRGGYGLNERDLAQLSAINDKRVLKVLLEVPFPSSNKNICLQREELLKYWLPLLTSEDAHLLSKLEKNHLVSGIHPFKDDLIREILGALRQVGDANQLPFLKKWRRNQFGMRVKLEMIEAYKSCVVAIEARAAADRSDSQLLRPSSPNDGADTYLRPVAQKVDENADTLLRAEIGGNDKEAQ